MKILHLSTSDIRGGAARGSYFLHEKLRALGVDSQMLVGRKYSKNDTVRELAGRLAPVRETLRARLDQLPLKFYRKTAESFWTTGWQPRSISDAVAALEPDIVHIQWTGGGFLPVDSLRQLPFPIVWTIRDMWPFTGGCHYSSECRRFTGGCGCCPQLRSDAPADISSAIVNRKRSAWRDSNIWFVPISEWLSECLLASAAIGGRPGVGSRVRVIPSGIDCTGFHPIERDLARRELGLPTDRRYILFSALNALTDTRKGFRHLTDAISALARDTGIRDVELLVAGDTEPDPPLDIGIPVRFLGTIHDDALMRTAYAAADIVAAPSLEEAFGKVHAEALACGRPVVAYDSGGPGEIVCHRETGYLAAFQDRSDLAAGLAWCLRRLEIGHDFTSAARHRAQSLYDTGVVAQRYLELYGSILQEVKS